MTGMHGNRDYRITYHSADEVQESIRTLRGLIVGLALGLAAWIAIIASGIAIWMGVHG